MICEKIIRLKHRLPQFNWGERMLYAISALINKHQSKYSIGHFVLKTPIMPHWSSELPSQTYSKLVAVMGCGHSGSGAVLDLLAEYDGVTTLYNHELDSGNQNKGFVEFEILRHSGGLFTLEKSVIEQYEAQQDAAVKQFLNLVEWFYSWIGGPYNTNFLKLTRRFLDSILLARIPAPNSDYYAWLHCPHLRLLGTGGDRLIWNDEKGDGRAIYLLKKISVEKYREFAREYILGILRSIPSQSVLVLDQMLQDSFCDIDRYQDYVGPFRAIYSIRDPRDVYVTGRKLGELWIPSDPQVFVEWYLEKRGVARCKALSHPDALVIQFEDLLVSYDKTVKKIEEHLGLMPSQHIRRKTYFNPNVSKKNMGSFKAFEDQDAIQYIERALSDFCYHEC